MNLLSLWSQRRTVDFPEVLKLQPPTNMVVVTHKP